MADSLTGTCFVPADVPLQEAVRRALNYFHSADFNLEPDVGSPWVKQALQLHYRGAAVPVSPEDSVGTLEARILAYRPLGRSRKAADPAV